MVRVAAILILVLGASTLCAHPFDDRCDMLAEIFLLKNPSNNQQYVRLQVQYRYETPIASFNEAYLQLDANRDQRVSREELDARFRVLSADLIASAVLTIRDERATIAPLYDKFEFANLDDPDASVDSPNGMSVENLRIGYFFYFDVQFASSWGPGTHPLQFSMPNKRIAITEPESQLLAWDDRGAERRAVTSVMYDRTEGGFDRLTFNWVIDKESSTTATLIQPDKTPDATPDIDPDGKQQLIDTDKERRDEGSSDSFINKAFQQLRDGDASLWLWLTILGGMFVFGAYHAVQPGHGKTLVASYLIGTQGTKTDALFLGLVVTAAHTSGVYLLLGGAWAFREFWPGVLENPEKQLADWITLAVGATIFLMGGGLVMKRAGGGHHEHDIFGRHVDGGGHSHDHPATSASAHEKNPEHSDIQPHQHTHDGHTHDHHHDAHGHSHSHGLGGELDPSKMTRWEILRLGILGGVLPCPSAFVIGLIALQQQLYTTGLLFVLAFSLGLGVVLSAIGLMLVHSKAFMASKREGSTNRLFALLEAKLPMFGALVITLIGTVMVMLAMIRLQLIDVAKFAV